MAKISLHKVQVTRVFWDGKGAEVSEKYKARGMDFTDRYSCFFDEPHNLPEGAIISVEGLLGLKIDEYTYTKKDGTQAQTIARTINDPKVTANDSPASDKTGPAAIVEQWPTATIGQGKPVDESAPF